MGTYIQVGVCTDVSLNKSALARAHLTRDEAVRRLPDEFLDLSMFIEHEDSDEIRWSLPREILEEGLVPFLRAQYALFKQPYSQDLEDVLDQIANAKSQENIIALAKRRSLPDFQVSTLGTILSIGIRTGELPVRAQVLIYVVAGRAIMEDHGQLFAYVEALIHEQRGRFPIAAAVKVFLE
jgi:hypothetical protein